MRHLLTGLSVTLLLLLNTLSLIGPLLLIALGKFLLPGKALKAASSRGVMWVAETWAELNKLIFAGLLPTEWDIRGGAELRQDTSYLVIGNHQRL
jgi:1-acyl-sn-glycerol-3-phosphate acyltransferase